MSNCLMPLQKKGVQNHLTTFQNLVSNEFNTNDKVTQMAIAIVAMAFTNQLINMLHPF